MGPVNSPRFLHLEGCFNARDLGGLPTVDGRRTRPRALVRADSLEGLSERGWRTLWEHGVRTVVDLRNPDERGDDRARRPGALRTLHLPLDGDDEDFWQPFRSGPQFGTPLFYAPHLERFPERSAAVLRAVAEAPPGGVAVHCSVGRDRTGMVTTLVLALVGVPAPVIADDYEAGASAMPQLFAARGHPDQTPVIDAFFEARGGSSRQALLDCLAGLDLVGLLARGGLESGHREALKARLVE